MPHRDDLSSPYEVQQTAAQIAVLANRIGQLATEVALATDRIKVLTDDLEKFEESAGKRDKKIDDLYAKANQWRGAFTAIMGLGGVGLLLTFWKELTRLWTH